VFDLVLIHFLVLFYLFMYFFSDMSLCIIALQFLRWPNKLRHQ